MEAHLKEKLGLKDVKCGRAYSGCINTGCVYDTDIGKIFVKRHQGSEADVMFQGEYESLKALSEAGIVKVPKPLLVGEVDGWKFIAMEYLNINSLDKFSPQLGTGLARLHLHNIKALNDLKQREGFVGSFDDSLEQKLPVNKFGFHVTTACGYLSQNNDWSDDWVTFYARQKLQPQIDMILEKKGNREVSQLWSSLQLKIPKFFQGIHIQPSLLHGDLWCGNAGETDSEPVMFDPASFYGHHEYDLAIAVMFGGFGKKFFDSYHSQIQMSDGFQKRQNLYLLFHHLNHWNHFGSHQNSSLQLMKSLIK